MSIFHLWALIGVLKAQELVLQGIVLSDESWSGKANNVQELSKRTPTLLGFDRILGMNMSNSDNCTS